MPSNNMQWTFEILDKVSGPGKAAASATDNLDRALKSAKKSGEDLDKMLASAARSGDVAHASFMDLASGIGGLSIAGEVAFGVLGRIADIGIQIGKFGLDAMIFREQSMVGLKAVLGTSDEAELVFERTTELAARMGRPAEGLLDAARAFGNVGFNAEQITKLQVAMGDLDATVGGGAGERFKQMMTRLHGSTDAMTSMQSLRAARELIGDPFVFKALAEITGKSTSEAEKLLKKHEQFGNVISKNTLELAIMRSVADKEGGLLGNTSRALAETLPNQLVSIEDRFKEIFELAEKRGALQPLHDALKEIIDLLNPRGQHGQTIFEMMEIGANAVKTAVQLTVGAIKGLLDVVGLGGKEPEMKAENAGLIIGHTLAKSAAGGFGAFLGGSGFSLASAGAQFAKTILGGASGPEGLDAHSPSRKFLDLGRMSAQGYAEGLGDSSPRVASATGQMLAPAAGGSAGAGRSPISLTAHVEVHAGAGANSEEIAEKAKEATISGLLSAFEQLAIEGGGV